MNTQSKRRFHQQMRLYDKICALLSGIVKPETLSYFFLLHMISGIQQAAPGGFTINEFHAEIVGKRYEKEIEDSRAVLRHFFANEHSSFAGKIRIRLFLTLLDRGKYKIAGRLMGLRC